MVSETTDSRETAANDAFGRERRRRHLQHLAEQGHACTRRDPPARALRHERSLCIVVPVLAS